MIRIVVYGQPAPQGSKKFVGMSHAGHAKLVESSKAVKPWRQDVVAAALEAKEAVRHTEDNYDYAQGTYPPFSPLDSPLQLRMVFTLQKPSSAPKRRRTWPMRTPDLSKLARSTEDALTTAGIWADDARVVQYDRLAKVYPGEDPEALSSPGCVIEIRTVDEIEEARRPF